MNRSYSSAAGPAELRLLTYLAPGLPGALFEAVAAYLQKELARPVRLLYEPRFSGPPQGEADPFGSGEIDAAFMCAPPFFWLQERGAPVELLGVAPVFRDARTQGRAVYFSELIVRHDNPARALLDLRGSAWAYNDRCSLSGLYCLLERLWTLGEDEHFFSRMEPSGSHLASIGRVLRGEVAAAAIDSNVLQIRLLAVPELRAQLKVIESWGPFPVQPLVVRSNLEAELKAQLRRALLALASELPPSLAELGFAGFSPVTPEHYAPEARALRALRGGLSGPGKVLQEQL